MKERLVEGEKSIFEPISKSNIKTSNEKKKPRKKIIAVLKEGKQALGVIAAKPTHLHEIFLCCITSLPLSISSPDSSLYQSDKASFRNYIMKSSISVSSSFTQIANWIIDGMAAMHSLKPRLT